MPKTEIEPKGFNYCKCGTYLYSDTESKISFARNVKLSYSKITKKFIGICPKCQTTIFICKD